MIVRILLLAALSTSWLHPKLDSLNLANLPWYQKEKRVKQQKPSDDQMIDLALKSISEKINIEVSKDDFHFAQVTRDSQEVKVLFGYNIIFLRQGASYCEEFTFSYPSMSLSYSSIGDNKSVEQVYRPNGSDKDELLAVMRTVNIDTSLLNDNTAHPNIIRIYEEEDQYLIENESREPSEGGGFYKTWIDKETGKPSSELHGHFVPFPPPEPRDLNEDLEHKKDER